MWMDYMLAHLFFVIVLFVAMVAYVSAWDSFVPNECFKSGGAEEAGMKGWRGHAADVFTDQGEIEAKKKFAPGSVPSDSVKFHDRFLIIDKTTLIHGMRRRNALRFGGKICRRQTRRAPKRPRCVAQSSWQEVFRVLIPRQVQYPRHTGEDITGRGKGRSPFNRVSRGPFSCVQRRGWGWM